MTSQGPSAGMTTQEVVHAQVASIPGSPSSTVPPINGTWQKPNCCFCLNPWCSRINLCISPSCTSKHSLIDILQTFLAPFLSNSVRRHFNESEPGQFRAETRISIHSQGTFSPDLSQEAKLFRSPNGIVSKFSRGQAAKFMRGADLPAFTDLLISSLLAFFFFSLFFFPLPSP